MLCEFGFNGLAMEIMSKISSNLEFTTGFEAP
jgi:hypothetical protein